MPCCLRIRNCYFGVSYGGYAALAADAFSPDLYRCHVSIHGVSDIRGMLKGRKRQHGAESGYRSRIADSWQGRHYRTDPAKTLSSRNYEAKTTTCRALRPALRPCARSQNSLKSTCRLCGKSKLTQERIFKTNRPVPLIPGGNKGRVDKPLTSLLFFQPKLVAF